ncbi:alpha/beta hydrolase [Tropicibacter naphthalenivorans]|uniref:Thermostable monoacylglycerol lipase n=1 Tax=Tropicibacter naphthalenivorans TaxID=441103 RepID=A0A0P1GJ95_9RHOB|nr:alpha/beta hydrolase [Tropicibacter naphthalenivorans]CUH76054.1 Thermostable monoacylglycerol lipase [Tropicibacter naphthalenivorans]SMC40300.1 Esterase/lipase [Tropicibacter naphthalenivorans]
MGVAIALIAALVLLWFALPREPVVTDVSFDMSKLAEGVAPYLEASEARIHDITPGTEKRVLWAGLPEAPTPWAVVYIHGFSATSEELRPLPDLVAEGLGANLVFTRLQGHGRLGVDLAKTSVEGWMDNMAEALAIAHQVGQRVLVISCSTGGTLTALALAEQMGQGVAGAVFVSPNFQVRARGARVLTWPGARLWLRHIAGRERSWQPQSPEQARFWTFRYPVEAVLTMAAAVRAAFALDYSRMRTPALFIFDPKDQTVNHARTAQVAEQWGARAEVFKVAVGPQDDPGHHVIAGDIMSPGMTQPLADKVLSWAKTL